MSLYTALPETQYALALSIFFGTFIYEDGATLLAATLSASGRLHPALGLVAAFAGVWVGDIGLYGMGSILTRWTTRWQRFQRFLKPQALDKAQVWFARHGSLALVMSRAIPGSRLPLYLAAGALQHPLRHFVRVTGICAAVWVSMIFAIWRLSPTVWPDAGNWLPWIITAGLLLATWVLGKRLGPLTTRRRTDLRDRETLGECAL
jgi:membrane protein DedA with SNARE-associated domain